METVLNFAKKYDYEKVKELGIFKGYKVYEAIYRDDDEVYYIGFPAFILEKDNKLTWVQGQESFEIMDYFYN